MKIAVVGHSIVHKRQQFFLRRLAELGHEVYGIGPDTWHNLRMNNYKIGSCEFFAMPVGIEENIFTYNLCGLESLMAEIEPDAIYCFGEIDSHIALQCSICATLVKAKNYIFLWENIRKVNNPEHPILKHAEAIICGNNEAKELLPGEYHSKCYVIPQVGIELDIFKPMPKIEKKYDIVFCGRMASEKGVELIKEAVMGTTFKLNFITNKDYRDIPTALNEGRIAVSLPIATPTWKEQSGGYSNLEAMACGLPVVTTECGAIPEYLEDSVIYTKHDIKWLGDALVLLDNKVVYEDYQAKALAKAQEYSNQNIARRLNNVFKMAKPA